jgi:hypothetical protein
MRSEDGEDGAVVTEHELPRGDPFVDPWQQPALDLWVDAAKKPIRIEMSGTLTDGTSRNIVPLVEEMLSNGERDLQLETHRLRVIDPHARERLLEIPNVVREHGGSLEWDGLTSAHEPKRNNDLWTMEEHCDWPSRPLRESRPVGRLSSSRST